MEGFGQMLNEIRNDLLTDISMIVKYYQKILTLIFFNARILLTQKQDTMSISTMEMKCHSDVVELGLNQICHSLPLDLER